MNKKRLILANTPIQAGPEILFFSLHISQTFLPFLENVLSTNVYPFKMSLQEIHALLFSETVYARIERDTQYIILEQYYLLTAQYLTLNES